ncbi:DUF4296 domain-containing protein [Cardinium endosymbiont of Oedothorax gibbosus]|uniref:DUF4296 domain-containing protein n=1 Tax=Cardinium endosymbiont of Oedothorax gibbosus TaxID=931101 RepID=UPI0020258B61|nr:DUF4296 domain-containing protein [Cardinium endosymbiont of Oedothorax gibbosus]CAH2559931.1 Protein of unknown function DUF4296 [Cardinium endosymbiont of Oedothorax gibbosus]
MKKIATILLASSLLYKVSTSVFTTDSANHPPTTIIQEEIFINVIRDLELLNSWLLNSYYRQETIDRLRYQNHQKILASYKVDPQAFKESVQYYLEDSLERGLKVYEQVCLALEALSI